MFAGLLLPRRMHQGSGSQRKWQLKYRSKKNTRGPEGPAGKTILLAETCLDAAG